MTENEGNTPQTSADDVMLTSKQVAEMLGVNVSILYAWDREGRNLPHYRFGKRTTRYRKCDVERWMQEHYHAEEAVW